MRFKKIILSTAVIVAFVFYVLTIRVKSFGLFVVQFFGEDDDDIKTLQVSKIKNNMPMMASQTQMMNNNQMMNQSMSEKMMNRIYEDGDFVGKSVDASYGQVQVKAVIHNDKIVDVQFLDHPRHRSTSIMINTYAMPILKTEAITTQSAKVDIVTGATFTSLAFRESMGDALLQAKIK
jgi:uncharacterized protein with FMN-binding domain